MHLFRPTGKTTWLAPAAAVIMAASLFVTARAEGTAEARKTLGMAVEALGGLETVTGWETRVSRGLMKTFRPGWGDLQAECEYYVEKPDKIVLDQDYSVYNHPFFFRYTYNEGEAWVMVNLGVRQNPRYNEMLEDALRTIDGAAWYYENCDTFFTAEPAGNDTLLEGRDYTRVGVVDYGDTVYFDIDDDTRMPLRSLDAARGGGYNHNLYGDYRESGGRLVPFHEVTWSDGRKIREMVWESIEFDVEIDPEVFERNRPEPLEEDGRDGG